MSEQTGSNKLLSAGIIGVFRPNGILELQSPLARAFSLKFIILREFLKT